MKRLRNDTPNDARESARRENESEREREREREESDWENRSKKRRESEKQRQQNNHSEEIIDRTFFLSFVAQISIFY